MTAAAHLDSISATASRGYTHRHDKSVPTESQKSLWLFGLTRGRSGSLSDRLRCLLAKQLDGDAGSWCRRQSVRWRCRIQWRRQCNRGGKCRQHNIAELQGTIVSAPPQSRRDGPWMVPALAPQIGTLATTRGSAAVMDVLLGLVRKANLRVLVARARPPSSESQSRKHQHPP